jgi:hypothetical protein
MLRWLPLGVGLAFVSTACALDVHGLGAEVPADDGGAPATPVDAGSPPSADAGSTPESGAESGADEASAAADAAPGPESGTTADAASDGGSPCDDDGDGHAATGPACGGDDCCDHDAKVHPGQQGYFTAQSACGGYDYDCDGKESTQYAGSSCQWSSFSCSGDGFAAPVPACGAFGTFTSCSLPWYNVFSCTGSDAQQAQACR